MRSTLQLFTLAGGMLLTLASCQQQPADSGTPHADGTRTVATAEPVSPPTPSAETTQPSPLSEEERKGEKGAREVLLAWASALERKDFGAARAQFADGGARSGMSEGEYAASFADYLTTDVALPPGRLEGAAGSLYYEVPVTISGVLKGGIPYTLQGPVVLRRVNDVPGATPEQLRWHIESADLKPVR